MRIYVAGPMRGHPGYNWPAFDHASHTLRREGHDVINPADLDRRDGLTTDSVVSVVEAEVFLQRDFRKLATCDAIFLLPGWEASIGARRERGAAIELGLRVIEQAEGRLACSKPH